MTNLTANGRLVATLLMTFWVALLSMAFASIVPLIWHEKFYIDGLTIINSQPGFDAFGSSFSSSALLLRPWISLAEALGCHVSTYGSKYGYDLLITNAVFGLTFLAVFAWFAIRYAPIFSWANVATLIAAMALLAPFYFCVTKELITFLASLVPLAIWSRWPRREGLGLACYVASMAFLGVYFRAYYLLFAVVLCVNLIALRRARTGVLVYGVVLLLVWLLFKRLPWELLAKGRADYLVGVTASRIEYYFSDGGIVGFLGNRALAFVSMMFPLNLAARSPAYLPFVALQVWLSVKLIANLKARVGGVAGFSTHAVLAFTMVQALFEPDYGSYFRHRVGLLLFILLVLCRFTRVPQVASLLAPSVPESTGEFTRANTGPGRASEDATLPRLKVST